MHTVHTPGGNQRTGEPWFMAKNVCDSLGLRTDTIRAILDKDEVRDINPNTIGVTPRGRNPLIINESGLYSLILRSRKPEAKAFKKWVTAESLPAMRKTGAYVAAHPDETPDVIMARGLLVAQETIERMQQKQAELEGQVKTQTKEIEVIKPKADVYRLIVGSQLPATKYLDDDEQAVINNPSLTSNPNGKLTIINRPGLYSLILRSRKPEAKAFKRWITHEVLPVIDQHGGYLTPDNKQERALRQQAEFERPYSERSIASRRTELILVW